MLHNISTLLTRNLQDVFGENDPAAGVPLSRRSSRKIPYMRVIHQKILVGPEGFEPPTKGL